MNKRYLPAIASILILAIAAASLMPAFASLPRVARADPTLRVVTIPEDDEFRKTGIILLAHTQAQFLLAEAGAATAAPVQKLLAQYKYLVSYNGVPVTPSSFYCQVIEKDKVNPFKNPQGTWENLVTVPKDLTDNFVCKLRPGKPGVGVIDIYFIGNVKRAFISDYVVVIGFDLAIGRSVVWGTEIQDVCVLGWPVKTNGLSGDLSTDYEITKPDGTHHYIYADPLGWFNSCEDAAMIQKHAVLGMPIGWT